MKNKVILSSVLIGVLLVGVFSGHYFFPSIVNSSCVSKLSYIKPNLNCDVYEDKAQTLTVLQNKLEILTEGFQKTGKIKRAGVFVRDLTTNRFAGVNDGDTYDMASLLKIPVMVGAFKLAEVEPKVLDQEIKYTGEPNLYGEQMIKVDDPLKVGESYSIKELVSHSIINSDNTAAQLLFDYYPSEFMDRIMLAIGLNIPNLTNLKENITTPRNFAGVMRVLYNASYLTKEYSNDAISLLTKSVFKDGVTAKLPSNVVVAYKFAERTVGDPNNPSVSVRQFHECGIVYAKDSKEPYAFCIMTEGSSYADLENVIADISLIIYEEMTHN